MASSTIFEGLRVIEQQVSVGPDDRALLFIEPRRWAGMDAWHADDFTVSRTNDLWKNTPRR